MRSKWCCTTFQITLRLPDSAASSDADLPIRYTLSVYISTPYVAKCDIQLAICSSISTTISSDTVKNAPTINVTATRKKLSMKYPSKDTTNKYHRRREYPHAPNDSVSNERILPCNVPRLSPQRYRRVQE
jgi:hypothetical protein